MVKVKSRNNAYFMYAMLTYHISHTIQNLFQLLLGSLLELDSLMVGC